MILNWLTRIWGKQTPITLAGNLPQTLHLLACQIHGSHYYQCLNLVQANQIAPAERLTLVREPSNEYDKYAIEVLNADGIKLGYVPKNHNRVIAELMDQHCSIHAVVERVEPQAWEPVSIRIEWRIH